MKGRCWDLAIACSEQGFFDAWLLDCEASLATDFEFSHSMSSSSVPLSAQSVTNVGMKFARLFVALRSSRLRSACPASRSPPQLHPPTPPALTPTARRMSTRVVPMPSTISPEAQEWLASLAQKEIPAADSGRKAHRHGCLAQVGTPPRRAGFIRSMLRKPASRGFAPISSLLWQCRRPIAAEC